MLVTVAELRAAINSGTFLQIFDEDADGAVADDDRNVAFVLERASAKVLSRLPPTYRSWAEIAARLPEHAPMLLKSAAIDFAYCLALDRHPEFGKTYGREEADARWKRAEAEMELVAKAIQRLIEVPEMPANVGGSARSGDPDDPTPRVKLFADGTGIF